MKKILLVLASAAALACSTALAGETTTYLHYVGQSLYATEEAEEQELEGGLVEYTATTEVPSAKATMETVTIVRSSDGQWLSHTFIFRPAAGMPQSVSVKYEDGKLHYIAEAGERREGDLPAQGEVVPLGNQFLSHYRFLLGQIDLETFKEGDFTLLLTANLLQLPMHVTNLGIEELKVGGARRSAWHLRGEVTQPDRSKLVYDLYVGPTSGELLQYVVPSQRYTVYERGWREEIEQAKTKEATKRRDLGKFWEEDVYFESGGYRLAGTVSVPKGRGPWPGVVVNGGSGPQDRDGNSKFLKLSIYKRLAHFLSEHGFVVLRFDKRNVGESEGNFNAVRLEDYVNDLTAAAQFLAGQSYVDPERIGLIGHSEGGVI
ncbi:MAG: alpha/beta hydrolase family protein, partial [Candidatus Bipolaricaulia bacterium]